MQRRRVKHTTTLEERLADQARMAREQVEKLPPSKERDDLIQKIREIEATVHLSQFLQPPGPHRE